MTQDVIGRLARHETDISPSSAVYGSDAMAGVVNFLLVDDFEGFKLDALYSEFEHDNDDGFYQGILQEAGYEVPSGSVRDGETTDVAFMFGHNFNEDRGNITAYLTYRETEAIVQSSRDHSACSVNIYPGGYFCGGSIATPEGRFTDFGQTFMKYFSENGR